IHMMNAVKNLLAVDADGEKVLDGVHLVYVSEAEQAERREHQYANACAEVSAVDADEELEGERARPPRARRRSFVFRVTELSRDRLLQRDEQRREEYEEGDEPREHARRRSQK